MLRERRRYVHGFIQAARGMCSDEDPHIDIDAHLAYTVDMAKQIEVERDELLEQLEAVKTERDIALVSLAALTPHSTTLNEAVESTNEGAS